MKYALNEIANVKITSDKYEDMDNEAYGKRERLGIGR